MKRNHTLPSGEAAKNAIYSEYKASARVRGLEFSIPFDLFIEITSMNCEYCGIGPQQGLGPYRKTRFNGDYLHNGIDRVDNNLGYTEDNIVPCCRLCNMSKRTMTQDDFIDWSNRLFTNLVSKGVIKIDLTGVEYQLERIAELLEGLITTTNPLNDYDTLATDEETGVFYSDDDQEIISERLARMGRSPKK